ncbi:MAG: CDP-alcohol phosphatidyltransferase family protein [Bacteroidetes bacterium]|nr:CDP-alcohol phosphatidyltransferase family protein [Bacteroidota bacterium]
MKLAEEYKKSLKHIEAEELLDLCFYRIISFLFVKIILPFPITPNQLSVAALIMGVVSAVFYSFGSKEAFLIAAAFYAVYYLFDLSDGQVARLKKNGTRLGRIIDGIADYVTHLSVYIGLGIGLGDDINIWFLVIAALICMMGHAVLFDFYRNRYLEYKLGTISLYGEDLKQFQQEYEELKKIPGKLIEKSIYFLYLKYLAVQQFFILKSAKEQKTKRFDTEEFLKKNKSIIRLWSFMGSSLHITLLIVMSVMNRIDLYLYGILIFINIYTVFMIILQTFTDSRTKLAEKDVV